MNLADPFACGFYRAVLPVEKCKDELKAEGIELVGNTHLDKRKKYDAYIFHRIPAKLDLIKQLKGRIIWEVDDALDIIPSWNPADINQRDIDNLNWALDLADTIIVPTEELKEHYGRQGKTVVLPNLIDANLFQVRPKVHNRVLWAGSRHHDLDLKLMVPLVEQFPELEWVFFGSCPDQLRGKVKAIEPVELKYYFRAIGEIAASIAVCPLVPDPFNNCKSGLKYLEMAANGSAVIASDLPPYRIIEESITGILAEQWGGWTNALQALAELDGYRVKLAELGREYVLAHHSWQSPAKDLWLNAFRRMV